MQIIGPTPDLLNHKLNQSSVSISPPGNSDAPLSLKTIGKEGIIWSSFKLHLKTAVPKEKISHVEVMVVFITLCSISEAHILGYFG